jgi:hypothetical protein
MVFILGGAMTMNSRGRSPNLRRSAQIVSAVDSVAYIWRRSISREGLTERSPRSTHSTSKNAGAEDPADFEEFWRHWRRGSLSKSSAPCCVRHARAFSNATCARSTNVRMVIHNPPGRTEPHEARPASPVRQRVVVLVSNVGMRWGSQRHVAADATK